MTQKEKKLLYILLKGQAHLIDELISFFQDKKESLNFKIGELIDEIKEGGEKSTDE